MAVLTHCGADGADWRPDLREGDAGWGFVSWMQPCERAPKSRISVLEKRLIERSDREKRRSLPYGWGWAETWVVEVTRGWAGGRVWVGYGICRDVLGRERKRRVAYAPGPAGVRVWKGRIACVGGGGCMERSSESRLACGVRL